MDNREAWDWVANNRGCIANAVRYHKLARWFDSFEDAFQEATIRIQANLAKYYDPERGAPTTFAYMCVWQLADIRLRQSHTVKHGGKVKTRSINPETMGNSTSCKRADGRRAVDADEILRILLRPSGREKKIFSYQERFDMLYAKLVADETWAQIASAYGYGGRQGVMFSVSTQLNNIRQEAVKYA